MVDGFGAAALVGRDTELSRLTGFLEAARSEGAALLLTGEPGVGKTALIDAAIDMADAAGVRVVRGSGVEYEADLSYAVLHQLVMPLAAEGRRLPPASRVALDVALGVGAGPAPTPLAVLNAALMLFSEAASARPLLLVVDDLHAVDQRSASAIAFVARRVAGRRIGVLAARRHGSDDDPRSAFAELEVSPLSESAALRLLKRRFTHLPGHVRSAVAEDAQGNPLALLEFAGVTRASGGGPGGPGSPARQVRTLFAGRVRQLPQRTRELLLLAALERTGDLRILHTAGGGEVLDALAPAERDRLVFVDEGGTLRFRHPLVRSSVVENSTAEERQTAHRLLADALADEPERRGIHLAKATSAPDETVAASVEHAAHVLLHRGDAHRAVAMLRRAAELTPDVEGGNRRLSRAAFVAAWMSGESAMTNELLEVVRENPAVQPIGATTAASLLLVSTEGDPDTAFALLAPALDTATSMDGPRTADLENALFTLALIAHYSGDEARWRKVLELLARFPDPSPVSAAATATLFYDVTTASDEMLRMLDEKVAELYLEPDTDLVIRTGILCSLTDRLWACRAALERVAHGDGPLGARMVALILIGFDDYHSSRYDAAMATARELLTLSDEAGFPLWNQMGHYISATVAAETGDLDTCLTHCEQIWAWSGPRNMRHILTCADFARTRAAAGASDFETAFAYASRVCRPGDTPQFTHEGMSSAPDLIEAALLTGRQDEAAAHAAVIRDADFARVSPRLSLIVSLCTAMTAAPGDADACFRQALATPGADRWPFEVARAHLFYGEDLRRRGRNSEARTFLELSRTIFADIGARDWQGRAERELRATGLVRAGSGPLGTSLTPQEREVARLAASGMSNAQIAQRLFLSPRTVSSHLYRVFPKLGVKSRAALRDALDGHPPEGPAIE